jgi:hypothetical protein
MSTMTGNADAGESFVNQRASEQASRAAYMRSKSNRKHGQGHPATADLIYTKEELEFHAAIRAFQCDTGKKFPTWSEVLRVFKALGYAKDGSPVG